MRRLKMFAAAAISLALFACPVSAQLADEKTTHTGAQTGKPAPDFTLADHQNKQHNLRDYRGKYVVLEWVNFNCPFSRKHYETGNIPGLQKEFTPQGVVWLSINSSAPEKQGNFTPAQIAQKIKQFDALPTAYLIDSDGKVGHLYGAKTTPDIFIVNPQGTLIYSGAIDNRPTYDRDDVLRAKNYIRETLTEALNGKPIEAANTQSYGCSIKYAD